MGNINLGFVGFGNMAKPIAATIVNHGLLAASDICVCDPTPTAQQAATAQGFTVCADNAELANRSNLVFLLIKPQQMPDALAQLAAYSQDKCFVSFAAGVTTDTIARQLHPTASVLRVMPNTPMQVGNGASALAQPATTVPTQFVTFVTAALSKAGLCTVIDESLMNAVIAVNGSTPALFYQLLNDIASFAASQGLNRDDALLLAAKTMEGSAQMVLKTGKSPQQLIDEVTSKGGTTLAMLQSLQANSHTGVLNKALQACVTRADELSRA